MISNLSAFETIIIDEEHKIKPEELNRDIVAYVNNVFRKFRDDRATMEDHWSVNWANYTNTPEANAYARQRVIREVGNVKSDWRHRINTGKTFEVVETVHGYLMQALFPNRNWLDAEPATEEYTQLAKVIRNYLLIKLQDWNFRAEMSAFLRQLCICGNSVMAIPWSDKRAVKFETLDIFDCYFNPREVHVDESPFIRRVPQTRADIIAKIRSGYYSDSVSAYDVMSLQPLVANGTVQHEIEYDRTANTIQSFQGIPISPCSTTDKMFVLEFWGDIHLPYVTIKNAVVTTLHNHLLRFTPNIYKCGRPFVIGTFIPVVRQVYGLSAVQSASGMIHQLNTTLNQLLDGIELAVNPAFTMTPDSTLNPNDIYVEPGKILPVDSHDVLRPLEPPRNNFNLGFQELGVIEQFINQNTGTGPLIGTAQPRGGERVTATEIQQVVEAGGNRLLAVHTHIQDTAVKPLLSKVFTSIQQFTQIDEDVLMPIGNGYKAFVTVGSPELKGDYRIYPKGAEHVVEREEITARLMSVLDVVMKMPEQMQQQINMSELFKDIVRNVLYEDPDKYILEQDTPQGEEQSESPLPMADAAIEANVMADGGQELFRKALGMEMPQNATIDPGTAGSPEQYSDTVN